MPPAVTVEDRIADLEKQVQLLTKEVFQGKSPGWVQRIVGSMDNDPDFAQILKLGQEIRQAERGE
jgi:hypothetical protein